MTRSDLIADLAADRPQLREAEIARIVASIFGRIVEALANGDRVELRGFGTFTVRQREARTARNPRTGAEVMAHAKAFPFFKASRELQVRLNRSRGGARG